MQERTAFAFSPGGDSILLLRDLRLIRQSRDKLCILALDSVGSTDRGYDALLLVAFQLPLLDISLTARTLIGCFGVVLVLHMGITMLGPREGLVAMWTFDNATMRNLLVVHKRCL